MYACYGSINFISANLTEAEDPYPYPEGKSRDNGVIAHVFFKLFEVIPIPLTLKALLPHLPSSSSSLAIMYRWTSFEIITITPS